MSWQCRLGMHRPADRKVFHRGKSFTRCCECNATLILTHEGWANLPVNKRVTWRERTSEDRGFAFSPNQRRARLRMKASVLWREAFRPHTPITEVHGV